MKYLLIIKCIMLMLLSPAEASAQPLPVFLQGTWKMENKEIYEHWDILNEQSMKGFSYKIKDGKMVISEYLDITLNGVELIYTASVLNQNVGKGINFKLTKSDTSFIFENPEHDFPKKIEYQKLSGTEIFVQVSDGGQKGFSYKMIKSEGKQIESTNFLTNSEGYQEMKKVTGIGGIFFKCKDPDKIKEWYKTHLGLDTDQYGTNFEWRQSSAPAEKGFTQWSPFSEKSKYFEPSTKGFMINYRVANLEALIEELRKEGVTVLDEIAAYEYGKFVHILDIEGNKIELWEPNDIEYDKIVEGRTK